MVWDIPWSAGVSWWGGLRSRKGLGAVRALLSSNDKIPVLPALLPALSQTQPHTSYWEENSLYLSQSQHSKSSVIRISHISSLVSPIFFS